MNVFLWLAGSLAFQVIFETVLTWCERHPRPGKYRQSDWFAKRGPAFEQNLTDLYGPDDPDNHWFHN